MNSEDWEGAISMFTESIGRDDCTTVCLYNRAICSLYKEDMDSAADDFMKVVRRGDDKELAVQAEAVLLSMGITTD